MRISRYMFVAPIFVAALTLLIGCSEQKGRLLLVGVHGSKDTLSFNTDQAIKDPESINTFKSIVDGGSRVENKPTEARRDADYTVVVNNEKDSTMETGVYLWLMEDGTFLMARGFLEDSEYARIDRADSDRLKELLPLE